MSSRRNSYDGSIFGSGLGNSGGRNPDSDQVKIDKHDATKRTKRASKRKIDYTGNGFSEENDKDRYLITYADLITLLLGLFIILYAMSTIDADKYKSTISALGSVFGVEHKMFTPNSAMPSFQYSANQKSSLKDNLQKAINATENEESVQLIENERGITVRILDDILFASGQADLSSGALSVLSAVAKILKEIPNDIRIEGHTDNVPINSPLFPSNWHLSVQRATNTAYYLMNAEGLSPDKVSIVGYSEYQPVADNTTAEGRKLNRRVDIVILNK
mgnify:CR=1 FL=1